MNIEQMVTLYVAFRNDTVNHFNSIDVFLIYTLCKERSISTIVFEK